jgi:hypothetical protein
MGEPLRTNQERHLPVQGRPQFYAEQARARLAPVPIETGNASLRLKVSLNRGCQRSHSADAAYPDGIHTLAVMSS